MKRMCRFTLVAGALVGSLALFSAARSRGEKPRGKGAPDSAYTDRSPTNGVGEAQEVEAFFDELIPGQLEERRIPGTTVAVVRYGRLLLAKGYGWADVAEQVPVVANRSLFHIGSNTKLCTWTAVMQLVEEGKLHLDADVNAYLDFRIPDTYPQLVTLRHLMTHTAGFENRDIRMAALSPKTVVPIGRFKTLRPALPSIFVMVSMAMFLGGMLADTSERVLRLERLHVPELDHLFPLIEVVVK